MPDAPSQSRCHQHLMEIVAIDLPFKAQAVTSDPDRKALPQLRWTHAPSTPTPNVGVRRRKNDQSNLLSTTLPPSTVRLKPAKFGTMASSATAGSSNESVPGKKRLPAIPCAWA